VGLTAREVLHKRLAGATFARLVLGLLATGFKTGIFEIFCQKLTVFRKF